jgi:hypothetical protein
MTRSVPGAAALLLLLPLMAHAHFFRSRYAAAYVAPAYYPAYYSAYYPAAVPVTVSAYVVAPPRVVLYDPLPVYAAQPSPVCVPVVPSVTLPPTALPPLAVPPYAVPSAAPPSGSPAIPGTAPTPSTPSAPPGESPSSTLMTSSAKLSGPAFYDAYPVASRPGAAPAADRRPVCFWNLSGRNMVLKVDGQTQTLPPGARSRLELGRQFAWQVDGHEARTEEMAAGAAGLEIVLRR